MTPEELNIEAEKLGLKVIDTSKGDYIPKEKFNLKLSEKDEQITGLTTQLSEQKKQADEFSKQFKDAEGYKEAKKKLEDDYKALETKHEKELYNRDWTSKLKDKARKDNIKEKFFDDFARRFDPETHKLENNDILGYSEVVKGIKENYPEYLDSGKPTGKTPPKGTPPQSDFFTKEQVEKMSYEDTIKNFETIEKSMKEW